MSAFEVVGLALSSLPLLVSALELTLTSFVRPFQQEEPLSFSDAYAHPTVKFAEIIREYGLVTTFFLYTLLPDALFVMDRVERYVLHVEDSLVLAFMNSYSSSFNMIGVAVSSRQDPVEAS